MANHKTALFCMLQLCGAVCLHEGFGNEMMISGLQMKTECVGLLKVELNRPIHNDYPAGEEEEKKCFARKLDFEMMRKLG